MTLALLTFANGDTNYISKHNANYGSIQTQFNAMETTLSASLGSTVSVGSAFLALFGTVPAVIGEGSYEASGAGSTLTVQPGFAWKPSTGMLARLVAPATIAFGSLSADTYYIAADATGAPQQSTSPTDALYSVVWTGSAFGAITRVATLVWSSPDWTAAQTSTALGDTFEGLDARLEAGEALIVGAAPLASPVLTGTPAAPTAAPGTDTTQIATTAFIQAAIAALVDSSPGTLDTLNELAAALGDDPNFAATLTTALALKAPLASPVLTGAPEAPTAAPGTNTDQLATTAFVEAAVDAVSGAQPFVVVPFFPGSPTASQLLGVFPAPAGITTLTFAAAIAGSAGKALDAATAQTDIDVRKNATTAANGTSVGTVRFAAAGTVPTFIAASGFTLTGGTDYLSFWAPATPDATLANFAIALYAER